MKKLLEKLETLVDEAIGLVREERQRRALKFMATPPGPTVNPSPWQPSWPVGPAPGWEITCSGNLAYQRPIDAGCAPPSFVGSTITICESQPNAAFYGSH